MEIFESSLEPCVVTNARLYPWELAALGGVIVTERKLTAPTTEFVRGVLIRIAKKRMEAVERYFPDIAENGYIVSYKHIDDLTQEQVELVVQEIVEIIQSIVYEEGKARNGIPTIGRPSLLEDDTKHIEERIRGLSIKKKQAEKALVELCQVYAVNNPMA